MGSELFEICSRGWQENLRKASEPKSTVFLMQGIGMAVQRG